MGKGGVKADWMLPVCCQTRKEGAPRLSFTLTANLTFIALRALLDTNRSGGACWESSTVNIELRDSDGCIVLHTIPPVKSRHVISLSFFQRRILSCLSRRNIWISCRPDDAKERNKDYSVNRRSSLKCSYPPSNLQLLAITCLSPNKPSL